MSYDLYSKLECSMQRIWDGRAPWLLTLYVRAVGYGLVMSCIQSRAVVDDFGTLVAVERFS